MSFKEFLKKKKLWITGYEWEMMRSNSDKTVYLNQKQQQNLVLVNELGNWAFNRVEELMKQKSILFRKNTKELQDIAIACLGEKEVLKRICKLPRNRKGV